VGRATACLDVSDGLARDARNLAQASGVRVVLDAALLSKVLSPELETVARALGQNPMDLAIEGGEDYALLATGPATKRPRFTRPIGTNEKGQGVFLRSSGQRTRLSGGFEHGA
jgi:thiamine-monophosphate kinase